MNLSEAIQWRWPGAQYVTRGGVLERWDGPMARPTDAEIAQALADYASQNVAARERRDRDVQRAVIRALAAAIHKRFKAQVPTDTTTVAQWEAAIKAEYDAL